MIPIAAAIITTAIITIVLFERTDFQLAHATFLASDLTDLNHVAILLQREGLSLFFFTFFVSGLFAFLFSKSAIIISFTIT